MRFLIIALVLLVSSPAFAQMPFEWRGCKTDEDCVIVGGGCYMDAVNVKYQEQGSKFADDFNARMGCLGFLDPLTARAICDNPPAKHCPPGNNLCARVLGTCKMAEGDATHNNRKSRPPINIPDYTPRDLPDFSPGDVPGAVPQGIPDGVP